MPPPQPPASTARCGGAQHVYLKTHGTRVARVHLSDWIVLVLLVVVDGVLNIIEPFHRFVGEGMIPGLRYPLKDNTVPVWAVPVIAVIGPIIIIIGIYMRRRNVYDMHHAILGLLFSVLITAVLTDHQGRRWPAAAEFLLALLSRRSAELVGSLFLLVVAALNAVIFLQNYNNVTGAVICHGDKAVIKEGYKSFPSGHTSWSFAGLGFLSWYLAGKIMAFDRRGHVAKLCIIALPLLLAAMVAVSRVDDYWHHWQDVFTAGALGLVVSSFCYLQFFPPPSGEQGFWPHSYFEHILTLEGDIQVQPTTESSRHQSLALDLSPRPEGTEMRTASHLSSIGATGRFQ